MNQLIVFGKLRAILVPRPGRVVDFDAGICGFKLADHIANGPLPFLGKAARPEAQRDIVGHGRRAAEGQCADERQGRCKYFDLPH